MFQEKKTFPFRQESPRKLAKNPVKVLKFVYSDHPKNTRSILTGKGL